MRDNMDILGKIRSSFSNKNGFKIGFSNRSPLNQYKSTMPTSFNLPKLNAKVGVAQNIVSGDQALSDANLKESEFIGKSIQGAVKEIGDAVVKKKKTKKENKIKQQLEDELELANNKVELQNKINEVLNQ